MEEFRQYFLWPLLAGLVSLAIAGVSAWWTFKQQHLHTLRMALFAELMGNRFAIKGDAFSAALNRVLVLFHDDPDVVQAIRNFAHAAREQRQDNDKLVAVFRSICRNLKIPESRISDADFETAFNMRSEEPETVALKLSHSIPPGQIIIHGYPQNAKDPISATYLTPAAAQQLIQMLHANMPHTSDGNTKSLPKAP